MDDRLPICRFYLWPRYCLSFCDKRFLITPVVRGSRPSGIYDLSRFFANLFRPFGCVAHKDFYAIWLSNIFTLST